MGGGNKIRLVKSVSQPYLPWSLWSMGCDTTCVAFLPSVVSLAFFVDPLNNWGRGWFSSEGAISEHELDNFAFCKFENLFLITLVLYLAMSTKSWSTVDTG